MGADWAAHEGEGTGLQNRVLQVAQLEGIPGLEAEPAERTRLLQVPQQEGPPGLEAEPMQFPPPLFSKQDLPLDYAFRSFYSGDPDYMKAGGESLSCTSMPVLSSSARFSNSANA